VWLECRRKQTLQAPHTGTRGTVRASSRFGSCLVVFVSFAAPKLADDAVAEEQADVPALGGSLSSCVVGRRCRTALHTQWVTWVRSVVLTTLSYDSVAVAVAVVSCRCRNRYNRYTQLAMGSLTVAHFGSFVSPQCPIGNCPQIFPTGV